jgi:hypothetical protein
LIISNEASVDFKIVKLLDFRIGKWYSVSEIKSKLERIYKDLGLKKTAKATDLEKWFYLELKNRRIDGKLMSGNVITGYKIKL